MLKFPIEKKPEKQKIQRGFCKDYSFDCKEKKWIRQLYQIINN
jgi:hypothetical protein